MKDDSRKWPALQIALDFVDLHRALQVAREAVAGGVDWLEVGTPLIKSEGLEAVRRIKKEFPKRTVAADMKTMDTGAFEVEAASRAGADIVMVLGVADDSTIREAVETAHRFGSKIMVDLIGVEDSVTRADALERLGVDYVCVHVGIDQQMRGVKPLNVLRDVVETVKVPVAVAGGMNSETAAQAVKSGASIVIVGGAITKAGDAKAATKLLKQAISTGTAQPTKLYKKYGEDEIFKVFSEVSTPNLADAMQRKGELYGIQPVTPGVKAVGKAVTVRTASGDWAKPVEAIDVSGPENVIVIDAGGGGKAVWGELATWSCIQRGIKGVVIDGSIRDVDTIRELRFPAFSRVTNPCAGDAKGFGEINAEITCAGMRVRPGDWVIGDDTGVVVVPKELALEIANRAKDVQEKENRVREEIQRGSTLSKVLRLKKWEKIVG